MEHNLDLVNEGLTWKRII